MHTLDSIDIRVETGPPDAPSTGNTLPLLHEIRHALDRLAAHATATSIDLRSLPLAPGDEEALATALGRGEIEARLHALGDSEIYETAIPGVWLVTHYNSEGEIAAKFIEITRVPQILQTPAADIRDGIRLLDERLNELHASGD